MRTGRPQRAFVAWFMTCSVVDTEYEAIASLVGGSGDKSLDALHVDHGARKVFIVQGKYRQKATGGTEKRSDVVAFADLAHSFADDDAFKAFRSRLAPAVAGKAEEARKRIKTRNYRQHLYYVTTGKCSAALAREGESIARRNGGHADFDVIDGKRVLRLLSEYLDGVAPPVPLLEMELESGQGARLSGVLQRFD